MFLFTRRLQTRGDPRQVLPWAREIAAVVSTKSHLKFSVWTPLSGAPVGALAFTTLVASRTEFAAAVDPLLGDDEYLDLVARAMPFVPAPPEDSFVDIIHTAGGDYRRAEIGAVSTVTTAQMATGKYGAAMHWSVEMAELVAEITGLPTMLGTPDAGTFGTVQWVGTAPDLTSAEEVEQRLAKDGRYLTKLDQITGLFVEGSGQRALVRRIA